MTAMVRDLLLYGAAGSDNPDLPRDYRLLHRTRTGRAALWSLRFGVELLTVGHLALLVLWLRRRELTGVAP